MIANQIDNHWREEHPEVREEWVERTLVTPYRDEPDEDNDRIRLYYGEVPETGNWLRVVVRDKRQLVTAYTDRRLLKRFGRGKQSW